MIFVKLILAISIIHCVQPSTVCPAGCTDQKPPGQPFSCQEIKDDLDACNTRTTAGERFCKCTCDTCGPQVSATPTPVDSWTNIDVSVVADTPSPTPAQVPVPLPLPSQKPIVSGALLSTATSQLVSAPAAVQASLPEEVGLAVGGARGVDTFRRNIENNKMPEISDITYEGMLNDYFFDVSGGPPCTELFCAQYSGAVSADPLTSGSDNEFYLAIGLQSGEKLKDFKRKDLNLVVVLDVSGSMKSPFGSFQGGSQADKDLKKIEVAKQAIKNVLNLLTRKDKFALVTFAKSARVPIGLKFVTSKAKTDAIKKLNSISASGVTNLEAGLNKAASLLKKEDSNRENRLIVITDANANRGEYSSLGLAQIIANYATASDPIFTTMIGVGLDFNTDLTDKILQTRGANYFSVYSPAELIKKLDEEFEFMVTPLVFDLRLEFEEFSLKGANGWKIEKVIGVPSAKDVPDADDTTVFNVNTLFPSPRTAEGTKGGIILIQLRPKSSTPNALFISLSYKNTNFKQFQGSSQIGLFLNFKEEFYGSVAIQKAILLKRYVDLMHKWILDVGKSNKLKVSPEISDDFVRFLAYVVTQNQVIDDDRLANEEAKILKKLIGISAGN
eukprot:TRINITY_DN2400_c0_g1_i4.p1 TRINITY_DN2400_c0_g1~~TRINITY_DN2400_c0_g1_i4.p1  ORF type:complete len:661 (-),score=91.37 TRINITY_DN2400_c0_g1_i4:306-2150(-)